MKFDNLHQILRSLYEQMMPLCGDMAGVAKGIAGLGALFYVAYRVWQSLARAEPIDVFPMLRPFAIGLCIMFFPTVVLGTINSILSPVVQGTAKMLEAETLDMNRYREQKDKLESELESEKGRTSSMDEQVALMEKSYELAAKYMGGQNGGKPEQAAEPSTVQKGKKNTATPVRQVTRQIVSSLAQPMSNAEFVATFSQERNRGFNTAVGTTEVSDRNTIPACVHGAHGVMDGQTVRLRLLEPMAVAGRIIPRNAVVVGTGKIQGERLDIEVTSLEYDGTIIPVELAVYDTDGQPGIFIPNSMEMNAVREVAANMGGSLGSSINISTNAGAQLASDLGKGLIQGTSQYIAKKMRTVKVHLKAGYRVMLYQEKD